MATPKIKGGKLGEGGLAKASADSGGGSGMIWSIPKEGGMVVRFMTEPDEWFGFHEYWNGSGFTVITEDTRVPTEAKPSHRILAPAVRVDGDRDMPIVVKLPASLAKTLNSFMGRYGTMMDRPYALERSGTGMDTEYAAIPDAPEKFDLDKYETPDPEHALVMEIVESNGDGSPFEEDEESFDEPAAAPEQDAATGSELFPDGEYRKDYTESELKSMEVADLWGVVVDVWSVPLEQGAHREDLILAILEAQRNHEVASARSGMISSASEVDRLHELPIRELRQLAKRHGIDTKAVKREELIAALVEEVEV
jgi:hypothetical protein